MKPTKASCAVAFTRERNNATDAEGATGSATEQQTTASKPSSLHELRTQLRAQLARNQSEESEVANEAELRTKKLEISKQERQQEARRQKVLAMLDADPTLKRAIYADSDSDPDNVILAIAVRYVATCEMLISKLKYDPMRLLELIDAQTTH